MALLGRLWHRLINPAAERFGRRGLISLAIGMFLGYALVPLFWFAFAAFYSICGDQSPEACGPQSWTVYVPGYVLLVLLALDAVLTILVVARAIVLFGYGLRSMARRVAAH